MAVQWVRRLCGRWEGLHSTRGLTQPCVQTGPFSQEASGGRLHIVKTLRPATNPSTPAPPRPLYRLACRKTCITACQHPEAATQHCLRLGICLVAGVPDDDLARAAAAGGTLPLASVTIGALQAAPLGAASGCRHVGLGPSRRCMLLEFGGDGDGDGDGQAAAVTASTLLLCGPSEALVLQYARAVGRCLRGLAAAVGTMERPPPSPPPGPAVGGDDDPGRGCQAGGEGDGDGGDDGDGEVVECLVFVAGGCCFEACLAAQLDELADLAKRKLAAAAAAPADEEAVLGPAGGEEGRQQQQQGGHGMGTGPGPPAPDYPSSAKVCTLHNWRLLCCTVWCCLSKVVFWIALLRRCLHCS